MDANCGPRVVPVGTVPWTELDMMPFWALAAYKFSSNVRVNVFDYLQPLMQFLMTPLGLLAFAVGIGVLVYAWQGRYGKELLLGIAVLTGMAGYFTSKHWHHTAIGPLALFETISKPLFVIMILILGLRYLVVRGSLRAGPVRGAAAAYLALMILFNLRTIFAAPERAIAGSILTVLLFLAIVQFVRLSITTGKNFTQLLSAFVLAGLAFYMLSGIQLALGGRGSVTYGNRFFGLATNPQNLAENTACLILMANYLMISGFSARWQKLLGVLAMLIMFPFLIWSGSRTGAGMTAIGLLMMNGAKIRQWVLFGSIALVAWEAYSHLYNHATAVANRLDSTVNDRTIGWSDAWNSFLKHPLIGYVNAQSHTNVLDVTENSFLAAAAVMGSVGLIILAVLAYGQIRDMGIIFFGKSRLDPESRKICNFVLALASAVTAGMFFDAYLLAVGTAQALFNALVLALTALAVDLVLAHHPAVEQRRAEQELASVEYGV